MSIPVGYRYEPGPRTCIVCGGEFLSRSHKALYCSVPCRQSRTKRDLPGRVGAPRSCLVCEKEFLTRTRKFHFRSISCRASGTYQRWLEQQPPPEPLTYDHLDPEVLNPDWEAVLAKVVVAVDRHWTLEERRKQIRHFYREFLRRHPTSPPEA